MLAFRITADAFMRSMVRVLVGTMLEVSSARPTSETSLACSTGAPARRRAKPRRPRPLPGAVAYS